jgi:hypothetical protein
MTTIALFSQELLNIDSAISQYAEQIAQYKQQKKQILTQAKLAQKAIDAIASVKESLPTSAWEAFVQAASELLGLNPLMVIKQETVTVMAQEIQVEDERASLVDRPKVENSSNEYFQWQPTSNDSVAVYFNIAKGRNHCLYLSANNKANLSLWGERVSEWLEGKVKLELRLSKRMPYKYELKIVGNISDDLVGTLTQFNIGKSPSYQLSSRLEDCPESSRMGQSYELACPTVLVGQKFESENGQFQVVEQPAYNPDRDRVEACVICARHSDPSWVDRKCSKPISDLLSLKLIGFVPKKVDCPDWHLERVSTVYQQYKMYKALNDGTLIKQHIGFVAFDSINSRWYGTKVNSAVSVVYGSTKNECAIALRAWYIDTHQEPKYFALVSAARE